MNYTILKSIDIRDAVKDHQLILRSFVAENDYVYFQTVIRIVDTDGILVQTTPVLNWKAAKSDFKGILSRIGEFLELTPHEVYVLKKKNATI